MRLAVGDQVKLSRRLTCSLGSYEIRDIEIDEDKGTILLTVYGPLRRGRRQGYRYVRPKDIVLIKGQS